MERRVELLRRAEWRRRIRECETTMRRLETEWEELREERDGLQRAVRQSIFREWRASRVTREVVVSTEATG